MITIATNMAAAAPTSCSAATSRSRSISSRRTTRSRAEEKKTRIEKLRGEWQSLHDQVVKAGGLHIIGTERHESRASTTSCAAAPAARATRAARASTCRSRIRCCASSPASASTASW
jgi:hypothetical protein